MSHPMGDRSSAKVVKLSREFPLIITLIMLPVMILSLAGQDSKGSDQKSGAPQGWESFAWVEKKKVLFEHFSPTQDELALIHEAVPKRPSVAPRKKQRVLLFYKCVSPQTSIPAGLAAFEQLALATGAFSLDTTDDPARLVKGSLSQYDALILLNSTGLETTLTTDQRSSLLAFVKNGKGLIGIHGAADEKKDWPEGEKLLGGVIQKSPWTAKGKWIARMESPLHPVNKAFDRQNLFLQDHISTLRDGSFSRDQSRVLLSLDMERARNHVGRGLSEEHLELTARNDDHPIAWIHQFGKGRVFYSNLGNHRATYWNPVALQHFLDGIQFALGDLPADLTPSARISGQHTVQAKPVRIVFLAGRASHKSGDHEFRAGSLLLAHALNSQIDLPIEASVITGWPEDDTLLDDADAIVIYADSDSIQRNHYKRLKQITDAGTGLFLMHYGVHPKKVESGQVHYLPTVGGYFKNNHSVNPLWVADFEAASGHPIRRGCEKPIPVFDEWYYHLQFDENAIPLLTGTPTKDTLIRTNLWNENGVNGLGKPQTVMWGFERPDGSRGGGFTGGHFHHNWAIDDLRKVVLNTIVWIAGLEVPENGVWSNTPTEEEMNANLDQKDPMTRISLPLGEPADFFATAKREREDRKKSNQPKAETAPKFRSLLDQNLSDWEVWMGVPHKSVILPGETATSSKDGVPGIPLGLNQDLLRVFSVKRNKSEIVLKVSGEIYAGLTTKEEFENYHLTLQFKWGDKKWEPGLKNRRRSGLLLHCVGKHGAISNAWKRSLECHIVEGDSGAFQALPGTTADVPSAVTVNTQRLVYQPAGPLRTASDTSVLAPSNEAPHGRWNSIDIYTLGDRMVFKVNGQINMVLLNTRQKTAHGPAPLTKGQIQIQSEGAEVDYRHIKIRPITEFPDDIKAALPKD